MTNSWDAKIYSQFLNLRTKPAKDLLSAIPENFQPKIVYDLGCGPGNSTILLKERWPQAKIIGLDSSLPMLQEAKSMYPEISFIQGDIADFAPQEKIDCLFANASLQWLDNHETLIPRLLSLINSNGFLAIQMPNNFYSPTHQVTIQLLQNNTSWQIFLKELRFGIFHEPLYKLSWYYDLLTKADVKYVEIWETTYFQEMSDYHEIFDWVKGTGLRPVLSAMDADNQSQFAKAYIDAIRNEYPRQMNNKILLPFKRIFIVAHK